MSAYLKLTITISRKYDPKSRTNNSHYNCVKKVCGFEIWTSFILIMTRCDMISIALKPIELYGHHIICRFIFIKMIVKL